MANMQKSFLFSLVTIALCLGTTTSQASDSKISTPVETFKFNISTGAGPSTSGSAVGDSCDICEIK